MTTRRDQILARAAELFASRGFHGVSVHDVGAACGISGPALYRHFPSKDAMLAEMLVGISETLLSTARGRVASGSPEVRMRALVDWHVDFALTHEPLIIVQDRDWASLPEEARVRVRSLQNAYISLWVETAQELHPGIDRLEGEARAHAVFGLLNSTPRSARLPDAEMRVLLSAMAWSALTVESALRAAASTGPLA